ncbi:hypothetical protein CW304_21280 [Bacillus sp. UFRGS-B20]|nr:hypothetical protein CW304_21280 [Bacillus sp. UFRGS-B20]
MATPANRQLCLLFSSVRSQSLSAKVCGNFPPRKVRSTIQRFRVLNTQLVGSSDRCVCVQPIQPNRFIDWQDGSISAIQIYLSLSSMFSWSFTIWMAPSLLLCLQCYINCDITYITSIK